MPIALNKDRATERLALAVIIARSSLELPQEWLERTARVAQSPSKTFLAMFGTALLAKATDDRIDAFALKAAQGVNTYSARGLCTDVLVPGSKDFDFHLGTTGREPLNNQPFFRYSRVASDMAVHASTKPHLNYLLDSLSAIDKLNHNQAVLALAAFIRIRQHKSIPKSHALPELALAPLDLISFVADFVPADPEGGKRGQALVAAVFDMLYEHVVTKRINDPSVRLPGDITIMVAAKPFIAVEVKQRPATETELLQFAERLPTFGVRIGVAALLSPRQNQPDLMKLRAKAWRSGVHFGVLSGVNELLLLGFTWSLRPLEENLTFFLERMERRLHELEVRESTLDKWHEGLAGLARIEEQK